MPSHAYDYRSARERSEKVNWKLEEIIEERTLDFTRPFLPESLAPRAERRRSPAHRRAGARHRLTLSRKGDAEDSHPHFASFRGVAACTRRNRCVVFRMPGTDRCFGPPPGPHPQRGVEAARVAPVTGCEGSAEPKRPSASQH